MPLTTRRLPLVTCHVSLATRHLSLVTRHPSPYFEMTQPILYQSTQYDGSINYCWWAQLEYAHHNLIILYTPPNTQYSGRRSGTIRHPFRSYSWTDRWFNVNQTYVDDAIGMQHDINLGTPVVFDGSSVSFVDLDLDFDLDNQWSLTLMDEDEYAAHRAQFNYPRQLQQRIEQAVHEVRRMVDTRAWPFASAMRGERLRIRPFHWSDLAQIDQWKGAYGVFDDPWIVPPPGTAERHDWFSHYLDTPVCRLYAIETCTHELVGHISLREIVTGVQARLGIGFAPLQTGKGYGPEALRIFLPYYFDTLGFQRMVLDVAATNQRAIRAYQKVGFRQYSEHYRSAADEAHWQILHQPQYTSLRNFFRHAAWGLQQLHYDMELTREDYPLTPTWDFPSQNCTNF